MLLRGCWKEDSISSVYEEEAGGKKWESERVRRAIERNRWRGAESETAKERKREERCEGALWGT